MKLSSHSFLRLVTAVQSDLTLGLDEAACEEDRRGHIDVHHVDISDEVVRGSTLSTILRPCPE